MKTNWVLKKAIQRRYRTQEDFAEAVKLHPSTISLFVNGRREASADRKKLISDALGMTMEELFD